MRQTDADYMALARTYAAESPDRSRKVGCVIVSWSGEVYVWGWNDFPLYIDKTVEARHARPAKYLWTQHAERSALNRAARYGCSVQGCDMYLTWFPCAQCAGSLIDAGIKRLFYGKQPDLTDAVFGEEFKVAIEMLEESGVELVYLGA